MSGDRRSDRPAAGRTPIPPAAPRPPVRASDVEIDLHGMTVRQALSAVQRHIERAHRDRLHIVKVIHGHGTGALKAAVQKFLAESPRVSKHYFASHGDGGYGVTIAELDYGKGKPYNRRANNLIGPKPERWK